MCKNGIGKVYSVPSYLNGVWCSSQSGHLPSLCLGGSARDIVPCRQAVARMASRNSSSSGMARATGQGLSGVPRALSLLQDPVEENWAISYLKRWWIELKTLHGWVK
jgi:hypothetical protein